MEWCPEVLELDSPLLVVLDWDGVEERRLELSHRISVKENMVNTFILFKFAFHSSINVFFLVICDYEYFNIYLHFNVIMYEELSRALFPQNYHC